MPYVLAIGHGWETRKEALLGSNDLQVRQIARRVGYAHHGSFTAAFTRHFGIAPKAVRRSGRNFPGPL